MYVPNPKGGNIFWICVKDHIIDEKDQCEYIILQGFYCRLFYEEEGGGNRRVLCVYPYLKHIIQLWPVD